MVSLYRLSAIKINQNQLMFNCLDTKIVDTVDLDVEHFYNRTLPSLLPFPHHSLTLYLIAPVTLLASAGLINLGNYH